jgi:hypothetical protein
MDDAVSGSNIFFTTLLGVRDVFAVKLLVKSLREFGGHFRDAHVYIYSSLSLKDLGFEWDEGTTILPIALDEPLRSYPFAYKVFAASKIVADIKYLPQRIIWLDPSAILLKVPELFNPEDAFDIALRPVHVRNVGASINQKIDGYWEKIYDEVELDYSKLRPVRTYVDQEEILPYFNCGMYSIKGENELLNSWWRSFRRLAEDRHFQDCICTSFQQRLFLHQSIFSALVCKVIPYEKVFILPREYGYPLHFHARLLSEKRHVGMDEVAVMLGYREDISDEERHALFKKSTGKLREWLIENAIEKNEALSS